MKKLLYISFVVAFLAGFASCEKCDKQPVDREDPFEHFGCDQDDTNNDRGHVGVVNHDGDGNGQGGIVDPDEDDDDLNSDDGGTIVDPDEDDEDLNDDDGK